MTDVARVEQLAELRDLVKALPVAARRVLKGGPMQEPDCAVCAAIAAVDGCASYAEEIRDYHEVGVGHFLELLGIDDFERLDELLTDEGEPLVRALAGALAAERCLTLYLLAGWIPPRVRRPVADRGGHAPLEGIR